MILKSELSSKHTFERTNSYDIPTLLYGFLMRMILQYQAMHSQSDVTRLYLPRKNGGRGLINITNHYKNAIINFNGYLLNSEEQFLS